MKRRSSKPTAPAADSTVLEQADKHIAFAVDHIGKKLHEIASGRAEKTKHDDESRIAHLAEKLQKLVEPLRKVEAARARAARSLTLSQVMAHLRSLSPDDKARVVRELQAMDGRGGVLG